MAVTMNGHSSNGSSNGQHAGETRTLAERLNIHRKQSQPMAPPFMVSAPGKVIVFGEHSVVYGKVGYGSLQPLTRSWANQSPDANRWLIP